MVTLSKNSQPMYFFHKNAPVHKNLCLIMCSITAVAGIALSIYFSCHIARNELFSTFIGAIIAIWTGYLVSFIYYNAITFQKNKEQDEIALQALFMLHVVHTKIMSIINELKKAQCNNNLDNISIQQPNSQCSQQCELNGSNKCILNHLIFTYYDAIIADIEQGMKICTVVKPSAFIFFRDALSKVKIARGYTERTNEVIIQHICSIDTAYLFLTKGKSGMFDMPDVSHFPQYADGHELATKMLSNHFSKMPTLSTRP